MNDSRVAEAVKALKKCKAQGLKYFEAKQLLGKQGFSQQEIDDASYEFPYEDASSPEEAQTGEKAADQAIAEASIHDQAVDSATNELYKDAAIGLVSGRSLAGKYFGTKAISDYAALKDIESKDSASDKPQRVGARVFERHRAVKYYAVLSLLPLPFLIPYFIGLLRGIPYLPGAILRIRSISDLGLMSLLIWSMLGCGSYIGMSAVLFLARKESTVIRTIYALFGFEAIAFITVALIFRSVPLAIVGIATVIPGYWVSKQVGLLSQLG